MEGTFSHLHEDVAQMKNVHPYQYAGSVELTGRTEDVELFNRRVFSTVAGGVQGLLLGGPPGIGKSRLIYEYIGIARRHGFPVAVFHFRDSWNGLSLNAWRRLTEDLAPRTSAYLPQYAVFEQFLRTVGEAAQAGPVCIFLDDVHRAPLLFLEELIEAMDELAGTPVFFGIAFSDLPVNVDGQFQHFLSDIQRLPYVE